jgi:hypothetical protein
MRAVLKQVGNAIILKVAEKFFCSVKANKFAAVLYSNKKYYHEQS